MNKLSQFWQELKRRKVVRVVSVYAAAAFVILELVSIVVEPLKLPGWFLTMVIVLLCIGFIIVIILSWIFDVTPDGFERTKPSRELSKGDKPLVANSWRIATYVSMVVILGLLAYNLFVGNNRVKMDDSLAKSIAVLPFENFSTEPDQEAMCMGLTDEIINHLYRIESFDHVSSLTSVLNYRDPVKNIPEIAEELGVNYILEGVYKKVGDQLRVSAQLIKSGSDGHIWQKDYDRPYEEIISLQSDIALQIADHLKVFITNEEKQSVQKVPTVNHEAYEYMQRALYLLYRTGTFLDRDQIESLAHQVIKLDPDYADAYALLGFATISKGIFLGEFEIQSVAEEALSYYEKALDLDGENINALNGIGHINQLVKWDYIKAEEYHLKTINNPSGEAIIADAYPLFLIQMNRPEDARKVINKRRQIFGSSYNKSLIIQAYILSGDSVKAADLLREYIVTFGQTVYNGAGEKYLWLGEYDSAKYYLESALKVGVAKMSIPRWQAALALSNYKMDDHKQANTIIDRLILRSDTTAAGSPSFFIGWYYSWIGEEDLAFYWLGKAYDNGSPEMPWLKVDPSFNNLKDDDRYWDLYEQTGHKAYDDYMGSKNQYQTKR